MLELIACQLSNMTAQHSQETFGATTEKQLATWGNASPRSGRMKDGDAVSQRHSCFLKTMMHANPTPRHMAVHRCVLCLHTLAGEGRGVESLLFMRMLLMRVYKGLHHEKLPAAGFCPVHRLDAGVAVARGRGSTSCGCCPSHWLGMCSRPSSRLMTHVGQFRARRWRE